MGNRSSRRNTENSEQPLLPSEPSEEPGVLATATVQQQFHLPKDSVRLETSPAGPYLAFRVESHCECVVQVFLCVREAINNECVSVSFESSKAIDQFEPLRFGPGYHQEVEPGLLQLQLADFSPSDLEFADRSTYPILIRLVLVT